MFAADRTPYFGHLVINILRQLMKLMNMIQICQIQKRSNMELAMTGGEDLLPAVESALNGRIFVSPSIEIKIS